MEIWKRILVFEMMLMSLGLMGCLVNGIGGGLPQRRCWFPAVYNFGDSNSDTGGRSAALGEVRPPNGETFFGKPSGRYCDGRLVIDFIAENLGLPYLNAYLDSIGTSFRHGANFATAGSSILPGGYSPFFLDIQISQFIQFKKRTIELYNKLAGTNQVYKDVLPRPEEFSKSLYTFDIGQNDLSHGFQYSNVSQTLQSIPKIMDKFSQALYQLYGEGARNFWIHNTGPIGCLPISVAYNKDNHNNVDKNGCAATHNRVAQEFNRQLKARVLQLRAQLQQAVFTVVDMYSAKYAVVSNAGSHGFQDPFTFCCCGKNKKMANETVYGDPCSDPSRHISWDGVHYSEAANLILARSIMYGGSFSDPPRPVAEACR
ncbi:PREDICTED: GDSL esterase/lipase At5g14450-like [Ipomoea nil]|uniref:GDSL esterase/lipase At5g14450-like n=1 Tax=Ipomoea nil TaxID=35883 RepID=UPI00090098B3|nr:PREDICTED: GDSL esterase/lipase At5g14450-like [Ipomoea nil]